MSPYDPPSTIAAQSLAGLAQALETRRKMQRTARGVLGERTGLSYPSLHKILGGTSDFKVSNLLAIANALGLEVALVPRGLGQAISAQPAAPVVAEPAPRGRVALPVTAPGPRSRIDAALDRLKAPTTPTPTPRR